MKTCFLVYCNKDPIIYGVYLSYKKALAYGKDLCDMRSNNKYSFKGYTGFYHYFMGLPMTRKEKKNLIFRDKIVFSACLRNTNAEDDGCFIKVEERIISE